MLSSMAVSVSSWRRSLVLPERGSGLRPGSGVRRGFGLPHTGGCVSGNGSVGEPDRGLGTLPPFKITEGGGIGSGCRFIVGTGEGSSPGKVVGVPEVGIRRMLLVGNAAPFCSASCFLASCSVKARVSKRIG